MLGIPACCFIYVYIWRLWGNKAHIHLWIICQNLVLQWYLYNLKLNAFITQQNNKNNYQKHSEFCKHFCQQLVCLLKFSMWRNCARVMSLLEETPARFTSNNLNLKSLDLSVNKLTMMGGEARPWDETGLAHNRIKKNMSDRRGLSSKFSPCRGWLSEVVGRYGVASDESRWPFLEIKINFCKLIIVESSLPKNDCNEPLSKPEFRRPS